MRRSLRRIITTACCCSLTVLGWRGAAAGPSPTAGHIAPAPSGIRGTPHHPHHPSRLGVLAAGGIVTLDYRTVDFNPDLVDRIGVGQEWHLAVTTTLTTPVRLRSGGAEIPAGTWSVTAQRDVDAADGTRRFHLVLRDGALLDQLRTLRRGGENVEEIGERLRASTIHLPGFDGFHATDTDHLKMSLHQHGFVVAAPRSARATAGAEFEMHLTFGPLRCGAAFTEVFPDARTPTSKPTTSSRPGEDR